MKAKIKDSLEILGVLAVIASLLFLAYEIRQSNRIARSTISYELGNNYSELSQVVWTDPDVAALEVRLRDPSYLPAEVEEVRVLAQIRRYMTVWGAIESAYRNGHQTREQLEVMLADVEAVIGRAPAARALWERELDGSPGLAGYEFYARAEEAVRD